MMKKKLNLDIHSVSILDKESEYVVKGGSGLACVTQKLTEQIARNIDQSLYESVCC